jgi:hypothetical protein
MARIVVCGYMVRFPIPGMMFAYFHYVAGLAKLGHEVVYLEESGWNNSCFDPGTRCHSNHPGAGLAALEALLKRFGLEDLQYAYVDRILEQVYGPAADDVDGTIREADLVLNIGGVCWFDAFDAAPRLALVDADPLFTQVGRFGHEYLSRYHALFSYGANIGKAGCMVPTLGLQWNALVPPVVPEFWESDIGGEPLGPPQADAPLTTIANWSAYGAVAYAGETYGQKNVEFARFVDLPKRASLPLELATDNMPDDDRRRFIAAGWRVASGARVSSTFDSYLKYLQGSCGEFSAAKNAYVKSRCGWVSDRTVCYLAAGRPAIVQETGISDFLPTGEGLITFATEDEAVVAIESVRRNHRAHRDTARQLAREHFSYRVVLPRLLEQAFSSPDIVGSTK